MITALFFWALWDKIVTHLTIFLTLWDKLWLSPRNFRNCGTKIQTTPQFFRHRDAKLSFTCQNFRHCETKFWSKSQIGCRFQTIMCLPTEIFSQLGQNCGATHKFSDTFRQNFDSRCKSFGTVRQTLIQLTKIPTLRDKFVIVATNFWALWEKVLNQLTKLSRMWNKVVNRESDFLTVRIEKLLHFRNFVTSWERLLPILPILLGIVEHNSAPSG